MNETQRLWVVSELYYPETTSTGYILSQIAENLANKNWHVSALCSQPTYSSHGVQAPSYEEHEGVHIYRCISTTLNKDILFFRLINLITISFSLFINAIWHLRKNDKVLVVTNPPLLPFLVMFACRLRGANCVLLLHDLYPDVLIALGKLDRDSLATKVLNSLNQWLFRRMNKIVVIGRDMEALVKQKFKVEAAALHVIGNWADTDLIQPCEKKNNSLLQDLSLQKQFVVEYAGNIGYPNDIASVIDAAKMVLNDEYLHFIFLGRGAKRSWLEQKIAQNNLTNVSLLDSRPRETQPVFLNACDIALISLIPGMKGVSVPSRTYNIMAAGKPIIAIVEPESEVALIVEEEGIGWVVPPNNPQQLLNAITEASSCPERLQEMGKRSRHAAETKYAFASVMNAYEDLFESLL